MSFWAKVKTVIKQENLEDLKEACKKHNLDFKAVTSMGHRTDVRGIITDMAPTARNFYRKDAWLVEDTQGLYHLELDNDVHYSSITSRLGKDGGLLMRDYTRSVLERRIRKDGGMVNYVTENTDGSLVMRATVMQR